MTALSNGARRIENGNRTSTALERDSFLRGILWAYVIGNLQQSVIQNAFVNASQCLSPGPTSIPLHCRRGRPLDFPPDLGELCVLFAWIYSRESEDAGFTQSATVHDENHRPQQLYGALLIIQKETNLPVESRHRRTGMLDSLIHWLSFCYRCTILPEGCLPTVVVGSPSAARRQEFHP